MSGDRGELTVEYTPEGNIGRIQCKMKDMDKRLVNDNEWPFAFSQVK